MKRICFIRLSVHSLLLLTILASSLSAQTSARTAARGLDQLVQESDVIVRGSVVSAKVEPHPQFKNLTTVLVTLKVAETLKGSSGKTLQFRQYIWDIRDQLNAAGYGKGQEMLLMLGPISQYGLRSPVGLDQGRFRITQGKTGKLAVNGRGNLGLFTATETRARAKGLTLSAPTAKLAQQKPGGPIALTDLEAAIRNFAGVSQ